jgi:hypothetical protein
VLWVVATTLIAAMSMTAQELATDPITQQNPRIKAHIAQIDAS